MPNNFRVSVIMGIYNCAPTLVEALDSLYAQTYQNFKIILCDDGSTDETYKVAEHYASKHDNIILVRNERNMGLNYTLNHCLEYVDTEYVARMDGDDISLPIRFEKEINFLDEHPEYAIVSAQMIHFDEQGEFGQGHGGGEPTKEALNYGPPFCHAPCMVRTEAYNAVGGYTVDSRLIRYEDYNLWMKMFEKGYRGYNLTDVLYAMRDDRNAALRRSPKSRMRGIYAHFLAYKRLNLSLFLFLKYVCKILIIICMPDSLYNYFHKSRIS